MRTWFAMALISMTASAIVAAPQQTTARPGDPTTAHVWIDNRGRSEAIPVDLQQVSGDAALRIAGEVSVHSTSGLIVRQGRTAWEYRSAVVPAGRDPVAVLAPLGSDGWETTGFSSASPEGTLVLLKRPR
jgi:hypothetical protein